VWISRYTSSRSHTLPEGDPREEFVRNGNLYVSRSCLLLTLCMYGRSQWVVEQPRSSLMFLHRRLQDIASRFTADCLTSQPICPATSTAHDLHAAARYAFCATSTAHDLHAAARYAFCLVLGACYLSGVCQLMILFCISCVNVSLLVTLLVSAARPRSTK